MVWLAGMGWEPRASDVERESVCLSLCLYESECVLTIGIPDVTVLLT